MVFTNEISSILLKRMDKEKKIRSPNYTPEEKETLFSIVEKYHDIIESRRMDAVYVLKKREAWASIAKEFNSVCAGPRDKTMLKHFYHNVKHRAQKKRKHSREESSDPTCSAVDESEHSECNGSSSSLNSTVCEVDGQNPTICNMNFYETAAEYLDKCIDITVEEPKLPEKRTPSLRSKARFNPKRNRRDQSAEALKKAYFKKKIELVHYQIRNEVQKFRAEKMKHDLEIQILRKQLVKEETAFSNMI